MAKDAVSVPEVSDLFGVRGQALLRERLTWLPVHTRYTTERLLARVATLDDHVDRLEARIQTVFATTPEMELLMTLPGVGLTLAVVIALEVGTVDRRAGSRRAQAESAPVQIISADVDLTKQPQSSRQPRKCRTRIVSPQP
ncbi:hypothetical protein [Nitrospira sp. Kam-Ns4a]